MNLKLLQKYYAYNNNVGPTALTSFANFLLAKSYIQAFAESYFSHKRALF